MNHPATQYDTVIIHYSIRTQEGGVIEDTFNRKPLTLSLTDSKYIESIRHAIVGMIPGERKEILVEPEISFGYRDHHCQISVPKDVLPTGIQEGDQLMATIGDQEVDTWVVQVTETEAVLDTNHPLSGETIEYTVELVSVEKSE